MYESENKKQERMLAEKLDGETVFSASHSEIAQTRKIQCKPGSHVWKKLDDENLECTKCPTAIKIDPKTIKEYL